MIFERLADVILKRSKLIVLLWIIVLICAVPFALKAGSVLDYDTTNMAGPDAESIEGAEMMGEYFYSPDVQIESAGLLVVGFSTSEGRGNASSLYGMISAELPDYVDENGEPKISMFTTYGLFTADDNEDEGVMIYAIIYSESMVEENLVVYDVPELRGLINSIISENEVTGITTYLSGSPAISYDTETIASEDVSKIDVFSILMILILVGLFFRSFVTSAMPPMTIGVAFGVVLCLMYLVGSILDVFFITEMLLLVSMLGAGCDYCIFILARYREERVHGAEHELALKRAVTWAGESITTSGLAVMIGFGAMSICSFTMISSMGVMLAIGIVVALLAALTLISSILAIFGERLFWPTKMDSLKEGGKASKGWHGKVSRLANRYFTRSVNASIKHAKLILVAAVLFTLPSAYIMATSESSYDMIGAMSVGEGIDGLDEVEKYSNGGMIMPNYAILELTDSLGTVIEMSYGSMVFGQLYWDLSDPKTEGYLEELSTLSASLSEDENTGEVWGIYNWKNMAETAASEIDPSGMTSYEYTMVVYGKAAEELPETLGEQMSASLESIVMGCETLYPGSEYDSLEMVAAVDYYLNYVMATSVGGVLVSEEGGVSTFDLTYAKFTLITKDEAMSDRSMDTIQFMDGTVAEFINGHQDLVAAKWLTGSAVVMYEISDLVSSEFLKVELLAIALIFVLLFFVMKSYVTPIRSILTILMSVVWTVAVTHLLFENLLGAGVIWMIPIILIVVCLGLGMDYDILLTTRIKENSVHRGMNNDDAIRYAVTHSGSVITICGLIMGGAFGTLILSSTTMLQEFGFALCFAILVDALIVRTYIVPAAMHILGDWNWKGPKFLQKSRTEPPA